MALSVAVLLATLLRTGHSFAIRPLLRQLALFSTEKGSDGGLAITLDSLDIDTSCAYLEESIRVYLDNEWIKQPIHKRLGEQVSLIYGKARREKVITDLGEMMMEIGTELESVSFDRTYDGEGDAFVGPWDIANKVSDLLMQRLDLELCGCAATDTTTALENLEGFVKVPFGDILMEIPAATGLSLFNIKNAIDSYETSFNRYLFLKQFLDGEVEMKAVMPIIAVMLGYQTVDEKGGVCRKDGATCVYGWDKGLTGVPDFLSSMIIAPRLREDLPEDEDSTLIALEPLCGAEMLKIMVASDDAEVQHRILIAQWLYVHGFMTMETFPATSIFVPQHLRGDD